MFNWFLEQNYLVQGFLGGLFGWFVTALGALSSLFFKKINHDILSIMLGFASGVMIAASFWSLLNPAIEASIKLHMNTVLIISLGFASGGLLLSILNILVPHIHANYFSKNFGDRNMNSSLKRSVMLFLALTIHNLPEGLAVGVAFGAANFDLVDTTVSSAIALTFGIAIQNFPEGIAASLPLRDSTNSRFMSFFYGQLSAIVEPIGAFLGALFVGHVIMILPFSMAFAGGAMIFVVVEELIPSLKRSDRGSLISTWSVMFGFIVMMGLDVGFS